MKRKVLNILVVIFTIGVIYEIYNYVKEVNISNDNKILENIKISDNLKETKQIAIMQQKEDFTWEDKGTSMSAWPDIKTFEYYGSECVDATGNNITPTTDVIQFDEQNQTATISTSKTLYCTLKFARRSKVLELMTETTDGTYLKTYDGKTAAQLEQGETTADELLRYVGTYSDVTSNKINNYICFGTENKDTCLANKGTYMYRIIGITTDKVNTELGLEKNQIKIIKATSPSDGTSMAWTSGSETWDSASVNTEYLNSTSKFLGTITGKVGTHNWIDLISSPKWYIADHTNEVDSKTEKDTTSLSKNYKIGLMYASDYRNSWEYPWADPNTNSWLNICHGLSSGSPSCYSTAEWTMSRWGVSMGGLLAIDVRSDGSMFSDIVNHPYAVRPVFYLTSNISISGGGTETNPFIISDKIIT